MDLVGFIADDTDDRGMASSKQLVNQVQHPLDAVRVCGKATANVISGVISRRWSVKAQDVLVSVSHSLDIFVPDAVLAHLKSFTWSGGSSSPTESDLEVQFTDVLRYNSSPGRCTRALEVVHMERWLQLPD
ncbi:hypothetical protein B0H14DRAFT_3455556 [Mycena olivaceomarginata]|nr:hypothetical protein B0H14DRAFT_3455556 [Mycena olivaceomarginata]